MSMKCCTADEVSLNNFISMAWWCPSMMYVPPKPGANLMQLFAQTAIGLVGHSELGLASFLCPRRWLFVQWQVLKMYSALQERGTTYTSSSMQDLNCVMCSLLCIAVGIPFDCPYFTGLAV